MTRETWIRRACAAAAVVAVIIAAGASASAVRDRRAVGEAERAIADRGPSRLDTAAPPARWVRPVPVLRVGQGDPKVAVNEFLNGALPDLGLSITTVDVGVVRPLGDGLRLAEVRVTARGDAAAARAAAEWVAVNREAVRLKSITSTLGADGTGECRLALLVVIA